MNGKGDKPRNHTKEGYDSYRNNKFWDNKENRKVKT